MSIQAQRSQGEITLRYGASGVSRMRESGSLKIRLPKFAAEAIMINTSGGLAGGDEAGVSIELERGAQLSVTTQAAERVYRSLGSPARVTNRLLLGEGSKLLWLPQETILFNEAALVRSLEVDMAGNAQLVVAEAFILGRAAMGEIVNRLSVADQWLIRREGKLLHAEKLRLGPNLPATPGTLGGATAFATLLAVSQVVEADCEKLRDILPKTCGVSCWNGKLVARFVAEDGFQLKKFLSSALLAILGKNGLPMAWTF